MPIQDILELFKKLLALPEKKQQYIYGVTDGFTLAQEMDKKKDEPPTPDKPEQKSSA